MKMNGLKLALTACAIIASGSVYAAPTTSAPTPPEFAKSKVVSIYSDAYTSTGFEFGEWGSGTTYAAEKIGESDNVSKFVTVGGGYFGWQFSTVNVANMDKLHLDFYADADFTIRVVPITGKTEVGQTVTVKSGEWTSVDLETSVYADGGADLANVYQIKFDNVLNQTVWIDNVYFYSTDTSTDTEAPTDLTASLLSYSFTSVKLQCQATDNSGAVTFVVTDTDNGVSVEKGGVSATPTTVEITDLKPGTTYNFTVSAKDADDNVCATTQTVSATTKAYPSPAKTPTVDASKVISIYSDAYTPATTFAIGNWGQTTSVTNVTLAEGDNAMLLENFNYLGLELNNNVAPFDASDMKYLHIDFYSPNATAFQITPVWGGEVLVDCPDVKQNEWNTFVVDLSKFTGINLANIYQIKMVAQPSATTTMFIDNIYFEDMDDSSVSALTTESTLTYANGIIRAAGEGRTVVCNAMGQVVANTTAKEISTASLNAGIYIARQGNNVIKFIVK